MKRFFLTFLAVIALFAVPSCDAALPPPLSYQEGAVKAACTLTLDGAEFGVELYPEDCRLVVTSPECISGTALYCRGEKLFLDPGGGEMELPGEFLEYSAPIFSSFSLDGEGARITTSGDDVRTVRVTAPLGDYTVKLSPDGSPREISFTGERSFTLRDIIIERE